jgi:hypothetical protein
MENFPIALIVAQREGRRHILSALPDAPVVDAPRRTRSAAGPARAVSAVRAGLAHGLERLAHAVEPSPRPAPCSTPCVPAS